MVRYSKKKMYWLKLKRKLKLKQAGRTSVTEHIKVNSEILDAEPH